MVFKRGKEDIGYGLEDKSTFKEAAEVIDFDTFAAAVSKYTPEHVQKLSGVSPQDLDYLLPWNVVLAKNQTL